VDLFDIGVKLSLTQNVGAGLRVIARDLLGIHGEIGRTQADLNRLRTAILGVGGVTLGSAMLKGWWDLAQAGDRIIQQQQRMISQGLTLAQVHQSYSAALRGAATIEGTTVAGNMETLRNLYGTVGTYINAQAVLPSVLRDTFVLRRQGQSEDDINAIYKMIDMTGMAVGPNGQLDPARFAHALDVVTAALNLIPHGLISGASLRQFVRMMQPLAGLQGANPEQFFRDYIELSSQLGPTGGRGLAYFGLKLLGGQLSQAQVATLERDRLLMPGAIGGTREHPTLNPGGIVGYQELVQKGELAWFRDVLLPHIGVAWGSGDTPENIAKVLRGLAGLPITSQRAFATLFNLAPMMARFNEQLDREIPHLQDIFGDYQGTLTAQLDDLESALGAFFEVLGLPAARAAIPFLAELTSGIQQLTLFVGQNQWLATIITDVAMAFGMFLTVNGGVMILRGALGMLRLAIPNLAAAFGPFAAGGAAAVALQLLTSPGGLFALAYGIEALGRALPSIPHWLIHLGTDVTMGAAVGRVLGPEGMIAGGLAGLGYWLEQQVIHPNAASPSRLRNVVGPGLEYGRYATIQFARLPPPSRADSAPVTIHSPVNVTLAVPPMSPADIERAIQYAMIHSLTPETLREIGNEIAQNQAYALLPAFQRAVQAEMATSHHRARRRTLQDPDNSEPGNLGTVPMGGL
jgi:hypothetical protein